MKKITLLVAMLIRLTSVQSSEIVSELDSKDLRINKRYRYTQPVVFVERGVEFLIFPNGEFDFNTDIYYGYDNYYRNGKSKRRMGQFLLRRIGCSPLSAKSNWLGAKLHHVYVDFTSHTFFLFDQFCCSFERRKR